MLDNDATAVNLLSSGVSYHESSIAGYDASKFSSGWQWHDHSSWIDVATIALQYAWSPIRWRTDRRSKTDFLYADYGALDCDGTYPLEQACKDWSDTKALIFTTKSDTPAIRRYRIVFPWERRITTLDEYTSNHSALIERYGFDAQCADGARFYWPGKEAIQMTDDGYLQPVGDIPDGYTTDGEREVETMRKYQAYGDAHIFPPHIRGWLKGINVDGERNTRCYYTGKYLTFWGMTPDKIIETVLSSDLPLNNPRSLKEAANACKSGIKKAKKIQANQG